MVSVPISAPVGGLTLAPWVGSGLPKTLGRKSGVELSTLIESRATYPSITDTITITDGTGELSKNGGAWGASVSLVPGDYYQARLTSSASYSTAVTLTVSTGDIFTVTTKAAPSGGDLTVGGDGNLVVDENGNLEIEVS